MHPQFTIRSASKLDALPSSHTCFNLLDLPEYTSEQQLQEKLLYAIRNVAAADFGFA